MSASATCPYCKEIFPVEMDLFKLNRPDVVTVEESDNKATYKIWLNTTNADMRWLLILLVPLVGLFCYGFYLCLMDLFRLLHWIPGKVDRYNPQIGEQLGLTGMALLFCLGGLFMLRFVSERRCLQWDGSQLSVWMEPLGFLRRRNFPLRDVRGLFVSNFKKLVLVKSDGSQQILFGGVRGALRYLQLDLETRMRLSHPTMPNEWRNPAEQWSDLPCAHCGQMVAGSELSRQLNKIARPSSLEERREGDGLTYRLPWRGLFGWGMTVCGGLLLAMVLVQMLQNGAKDLSDAAILLLFALACTGLGLVYLVNVTTIWLDATTLRVKTSPLPFGSSAAIKRAEILQLYVAQQGARAYTNAELASDVVIAAIIAYEFGGATSASSRQNVSYELRAQLVSGGFVTLVTEPDYTRLLYVEQELELAMGIANQSLENSWKGSGENLEGI